MAVNVARVLADPEDRGTWICCLLLRSQQRDKVGMWHRACAGRERRNSSTSTYLSLGKQGSPWSSTVLGCVDGSQPEGSLGCSPEPSCHQCFSMDVWASSRTNPCVGSVFSAELGRPCWQNSVGGLGNSFTSRSWNGGLGSRLRSSSFCWVSAGCYR